MTDPHPHSHGDAADPPWKHDGVRVVPADKLDPILDNVKGLLESADVKGPLAKVGDAAASIQRLSDDLDERIKSISGGLTRFSNYGLRQYEALAIDARQTLGDVDKFVKSLSENPSQIIFGAKKK